MVTRKIRTICGICLNYLSTGVRAYDWDDAEEVQPLNTAAPSSGGVKQRAVSAASAAVRAKH
jgi:hypothetical protein